MTTNVHVRNVDEQTMRAIKLEAKTQKTSINQLILKLLHQGLGIGKKRPKIVYHDLDNLAGSWTKAEAKEFHKRIAGFEKIDKEMWK